MPNGFRGWAVFAATQFALTVVLKWLYKLSEHALIGWADDQLAVAFGITSPGWRTALAFIQTWAPPAILAVGILLIYHYWYARRTPAPDRKSETLKHQSPLDEFIPNVRVADSPNTMALFDGAEGDKLIPLLEAEKIIAWGRLAGGAGEPPPMRIPGIIWRTHQLEFHPHRDVIGRKNQTFLKTKTGSNSSYYDVLLNSTQLKRAWPQFEPEYEVRSRKSEAR
jgi:hypothetical protein